jgi:two-component system, NarL family, response regulator LiaR
LHKSTPIRIVLVDDQQNTHDAITGVLRGNQDIHLVGQAYNGNDAIQLCEITAPDLVLMDVVMPGTNAAETTQTLLAVFPGLKVLVLSSYQDYEYIKDMLDSGAIGYVVKTAITEDLIATIRDTVQGKMVLSPEIARQVLAPPSRNFDQEFNLTDREKQILILMSSGLTDGQIAVELNISQPTVRFHFNNILLKLGVETRSEMLVVAAKNNLV